MVNAHHFIVDIHWCINRYWRRFCCSAIYLHTFLTIVQNQDRFKNILVIVTGLLALPFIFKWSDSTKDIFIKVALLVGAVSALLPIAAKWIDWAWLKLALGLGWINSRILLSVIYFVFLMPIAILSRLFTKDPLQLKAKKAATLYDHRDHLYTKEDLENIW